MTEETYFLASIVTSRLSMIVLLMSEDMQELEEKRED
jgi:hypothetical protein